MLLGAFGFLFVHAGLMLMHGRPHHQGIYGKGREHYGKGQRGDMQPFEENHNDGGHQNKEKHDRWNNDESSEINYRQGKHHERDQVDDGERHHKRNWADWQNDEDGDDQR